jgi:hypothetical protein
MSTSRFPKEDVYEVLGHDAASVESRLCKPSKPGKPGMTLDDVQAKVENLFSALGKWCPPVPAFDPREVHHLSRDDIEAGGVAPRDAKIVSFRDEGLTNAHIPRILAAVKSASEVLMVDLAHNRFTARTTGVAWRSLVQPLALGGAVVVVYGNLNVTGCRGLFRRLFELACKELAGDMRPSLSPLLLKLVWISRTDLLRGHWRGLLRDESRRATDAELHVLSLVVALHMRFYDSVEALVDRDKWLVDDAWLVDELQGLHIDETHSEENEAAPGVNLTNKAAAATASASATK